MPSPLSAPFNIASTVVLEKLLVIETLTVLSCEISVQGPISETYDTSNSCVLSDLLAFQVRRTQLNTQG